MRAVRREGEGRGWIRLGDGREEGERRMKEGEW